MGVTFTEKSFLVFIYFDFFKFVLRINWKLFVYFRNYTNYSNYYIGKTMKSLTVRWTGKKTYKGRNCLILYIYIYMCVCVFVQNDSFSLLDNDKLTFPNTSSSRQKCEMNEINILYFSSNYLGIYFCLMSLIKPVLFCLIRYRIEHTTMRSHHDVRLLYVHIIDRRAHV